MSDKAITATLEPVTQRTGCIRLPGQRLPLWYLDERNILLFDSGLAVHRQALADCLVENHLTPRAVLTSHSHMDHIGNHAFLQERYGTQVWMTALDAALSRTPEALMLLFPNFGRRSLLSSASSMLVESDHIIAAGATQLLVECEPIGVLPLPGHSPGQIGFLLPDGVAYLGDLLLSQRLLERMRHPFSLCWVADIQSKRRVLPMVGTTAIVAHNEVCHDVPALAHRNLELVRQRMQELLDNITPMCTVVDLIHTVYADYQGAHNDYDLLVLDKTLHMMVAFLVDIGCLQLAEQKGAIHLVPTGQAVPPLLTAVPGETGETTWKY